MRDPDTMTISPVAQDCPQAWDVPDDHLAPPSAHRVLHLINGEHYSGAERVQDLLAIRLPEFGFEVGSGFVG